MGKRASKPTQLRVLENSRSEKGEKPEVTLAKEPQPTVAEPEPPVHLDKKAKSVWKKLAPQLLELKLLTEIDGAAFGMLCQQISRIDSIHKFINKNNQSLIQEKITIDGSGQEHSEYKPSAYVVMEKQYYQIFRQFAKEFGLTPVGRVGLTVGAPNKTGDDENILD